MPKKKSSQRLKREVVRVEGQIPGIRSAEERTAMKSRVERYLLGNIFLKRLLENRLLTKSEFKTLDKRNVQQSGLRENSIFRSPLEDFHRDLCRSQERNCRQAIHDHPQNACVRSM